jgi:hypothetical protein
MIGHCASEFILDIFTVAMDRWVILTVTIASLMLIDKTCRAFEEETYEQSRKSSDYMAKMMGGKQFGRGRDEKDPAVKSDLKYIVCGACEGIAKQAVLSVKRNKSEETPMKKVRATQRSELLGIISSTALSLALT